MTIEYYVPDWMLKRAAKQLSRQFDITHYQVLNKLAVEQGFRDWADLQHKGSYFESDEDHFEWISNATSKIASSIEY